MLRNFKRFTLQVVAGANLATIFMMLFVGFSDRFNPVNHQVLANAGLVFPVFLGELYIIEIKMQQKTY